MAIYGYCRISRPTQNIERQVRNILKIYPDAIIIKEIYTGTTFQGRKELDKLLKRVLPGDKIIYDSASRMARNADEGYTEYEALFSKGIVLEFLNEPHINTEVFKQAIQRQIEVNFCTGDEITDKFLNTVISALNDLLLDVARRQIKIAFEQAKKEVTDLRERTRQGILTAKLNGKQIGAVKGKKLVTKKSVSVKKEILKHAKAFGGSLTDAECIKLTGIARNTYYKYKRELREELTRNMES